MKISETDRLILRTWIDADLHLMFDINPDPKVMEYFPGLQDQGFFIENTSRLFIKYF